MYKFSHFSLVYIFLLYSAKPAIINPLEKSSICYIGFQGRFGRFIVKKFHSTFILELSHPQHERYILEKGRKRPFLDFLLSVRHTVLPLLWISQKTFLVRVLFQVFLIIPLKEGQHFGDQGNSNTDLVLEMENHGRLCPHCYQSFFFVSFIQTSQYIIFFLFASLPYLRAISFLVSVSFGYFFWSIVEFFLTVA